MTDPVAEPREPRPVSLANVVGLMGDLCILGGVVVTTSVVTGVDRPILLVGAQSVLPLVGLTMWATAAAQATRRRWRRGSLAALTAVVITALCAPVAVASGEAPARRAPRWTITAANARFDNTDIAGVARRLLATRAEVIAVVEATPDLVSEVERRRTAAGYVYQDYAPSDGGVLGILVLTRDRPVATGRFPVGDRPVPWVRLAKGGRTLDVWPVHPSSPSVRRWRDEAWETSLNDLTSAARAATRPTVIVGDLNASVWNAPLRDVLDAAYRDAHAELGRGLVGSWAPLALAPLAPVLARLDHCLMSDGVTAVAVRDLVVPGGDHRGLEVTVAVD